MKQTSLSYLLNRHRAYPPPSFLHRAPHSNTIVLTRVTRSISGRGFQPPSSRIIVEDGATFVLALEVMTGTWMYF